MEKIEKPDSSVFKLVRMKARNRKENTTIPSETFLSGSEHGKEMVIALAVIYGQAQVDGWIYSPRECPDDCIR